MFGAEQISKIANEMPNALLEAGSAGLPLAAALGSSFAALLAAADVSLPARVASPPDGSEDEEKAQVECKDDCE